jgi:hypothetical protein
MSISLPLYLTAVKTNSPLIGQLKIQAQKMVQLVKPC